MSTNLLLMIIGTGNFLVPTSNSLMDIFHTIPLEIQPWPTYNDEIVWTPKDHGILTLKSPYGMVCSLPNQDLQWRSLIWFPMCACVIVLGGLHRI